MKEATAWYKNPSLIAIVTFLGSPSLAAFFDHPKFAYWILLIGFPGLLYAISLSKTSSMKIHASVTIVAIAISVIVGFSTFGLVMAKAEEPKPNAPSVSIDSHAQGPSVTVNGGTNVQAAQTINNAPSTVQDNSVTSYNQSGGITAHNVYTGNPKRVLTDQQCNELAAFLSEHRDVKFTIVIDGYSDLEIDRFGQQIVSAAELSKIPHEISKIGISSSPSLNLIFAAKNPDSQMEFMNSLQTNFTKMGFKSEIKKFSELTVPAMMIENDDVVLVVGKNDSD